MSVIREPVNDTERVLREACSFVLQLPAVSIDLERSFVANGGDSISAMRVSPRCKAAKVVVPVATLLTNKSLANVAAHVSSPDTMASSSITQLKEVEEATVGVTNTQPKIEPFSLLKLSKNELDNLLAQIAPTLRVPASQVRDVAPTTHTQALCADAAMRTPPQGFYIFYIDIPEPVQLDTITSFAQKLWDQVDMLRTVFVQRPDSGVLLQVVTAQSPAPLQVHAVSETTNIHEESENVFAESIQSQLRPGALWTQFLVFHRSGTPTRLALRLSHAHYDGMSLPPLLECLAATLQEKPWPVIPKFVDYVAHVLEQNKQTLQHWRMTLRGSEPLPLQPTGRKSRILTSTSVIEYPPRVADFTEASAFLATCAETLARLHDTRDVHFSLTVSGRTLLPDSLSNIVGPCLNQVPLRVVLPPEPSFKKTLGLVRQAQLDMLPAEMATLQDIYQVCTNWPEKHRKMSYNVHFHDVDSRSIDLLGDGAQTPLLTHGPRGVWEHSEAIWIIASPAEGTWQIALSGNASHCTSEYLDKILDTLALVVAVADV